MTPLNWLKAQKLGNAPSDTAFDWPVGSMGSLSIETECGGGGMLTTNWSQLQQLDGNNQNKSKSA